MMKHWKILLRFALYWFITTTVAAFTVSLISFFQPLENFEDYGWKSILLHESKYIIRTFYIVALVSYAFAAAGFIVNLLLFAVFRNTSWLRYIIVFINLVLLFSVPFLWNMLGYSVSSGIYTYVLPVYAAVLITGGIWILPTRVAATEKNLA